MLTSSFCRRLIAVHRAAGTSDAVKARPDEGHDSWGCLPHAPILRRPSKGVHHLRQRRRGVP